MRYFMPSKIAHLTSAHPRYDTRIFIKECTSLADAKYHVSLVVADGGGDEIKNGVHFVDVGEKEGNRFTRMTKTVRKVYKKAIELDADVYHLHDPELIPIGLKLKKKGKIIIFDAHEDLPNQLLEKSYLNKFLLKILSKIATRYESYSTKKFDAIITATPFIRDKFLAYNPKTIDINNFPKLSEFPPYIQTNRNNTIVYIGEIARVRGIKEIVKALQYTPQVRLNLGGNFCESDVEADVKSYPQWNQVNELGFLNRLEVSQILSQSTAGLVTLHPTRSYIDSLPVKMFEYMASSLPIIASDFPLWRSIIEKAQCGICVDPLDPYAISEAINWILSHPSEAHLMGQNGLRAVQEKYNWEQEEKKLLALYSTLLGSHQ